MKNGMAENIVTQDQIIINSDIETIADTRRWAAQHAQAAGFDKDAVFAVELAVGEAVTNIIRHAYDNQPGHEIHLSLTIDDTKFSLRILDFGRKFDPAKQPPPDLDAPREGGYGIYLMKKVMDEVIYDTTTHPHGTQLDLIKYRATIAKD